MLNRFDAIRVKDTHQTCRSLINPGNAFFTNNNSLVRNVLKKFNVMARKISKKDPRCLKSIVTICLRSLVAEVTDDKTLPYGERKRLQVVNAASKSAKAKLIALADKLHNARDVAKAPPVGWSQDRVDVYFAWSEKVSHGRVQFSGLFESIYDFNFLFNWC